jgi:hypothetical protein
VDLVAQRYGQRPSTLLKGRMEDWWLDEATYRVGIAAEKRKARTPPATAPDGQDAAHDDEPRPVELQQIGGDTVLSGDLPWIPPEPGEEDDD